MVQSNLFIYLFISEQLRYQKCLDAHPGSAEAGSSNGSGNDTSGRGLGATIKSFVGSLTGRRTRGVS